MEKAPVTNCATTANGVVGKAYIYVSAPIESFKLQGRVLAAVGYSGATVDDRVAEVFYGKTWAYRKGRVADTAQLAKLAREMEGAELAVTVDLHLGTFVSTIYTCDFSLDYVHINADYTT